MGFFSRRRRAQSPTPPPGSPDQREAPEPPAALAALGASSGLVWLGSLPGGDPVWSRWASKDEIGSLWQRLRGSYPETGLWPVILGDPGDFYSGLPLGARPEYDVEQERRAAAGLDLQSALRAIESMAQDDEEDPAAEFDDREPLTLEPVPGPRFSTWAEDGWLALVPTRDPLEIPLLLGWDGGCNYEVTPAIHATVLRDWHRRYGVELVAMTGDQVMELWVPAPPATTSECHQVAREQFGYCYDIVAQGVGSIHNLAATQASSPSWYFWWD